MLSHFPHSEVILSMRSAIGSGSGATRMSHFFKMAGRRSTSTYSGLIRIFVLLSENSSKSDWVKREISLAFDLSKNKQLALVPMLIDNTEVPLEFKGLLYVDARRSFEEGLDKLIDFFSSQIKPVFALDPGRYFNQKTCKPQLSGLELGDIRFLLTRRLTIEHIKVIWFDIFQARMEDEVNIQSLAQCCVELIDRSRREELLQKLVRAVCRNHPRLGELASAGGR